MQLPSLRIGLRRKHWVVTGIFIAIAMGATTATALVVPNVSNLPVLAACTRYEYNLFPAVDFDQFSPENPLLKTVTASNQWKRTYHRTVELIIEEDVGTRSQNPNSPLRRYPLFCTAQTRQQYLPARPYLESLASRLPSWNEYPNRYTVGQDDMGTVLLEYLRMYECAIVERMLLLPAETLSQEVRRQVVLFGLPSPIAALSIVKSTSLAVKEQLELVNELAQSRVSLHRTLTLIAGMNRMRPIDTELTCIQQATPDIRNAFALASDASSCMPRVWNAIDPLRDLAPEEDS